MNTRAVIPFANREAAFTMIEIAISLGVIAFALIAIIGILPIGLGVQKDNREETIINQDARLIVEALKSGGRDGSVGVGSLGAFVVRVDGTNYLDPENGLSTSNLVQLLSDTNQSHRIIMSAISGSLAGREGDIPSRENGLTFRYQILNNVLDPTYPTFFAPRETNFFGGVDHFLDRDPRAINLTNQIHDVRLRFVWPLRPDPNDKDNFIPGIEANRYVVRVMVGGWHVNGVLKEQEYYNPLNLNP